MIKFFKKGSFVAAAIILIIFLYKLGIFNFFAAVSNKVIFNINRIGSFSAELIEPIFIKKNLIEENKNLKNQIFALQKELIDSKATEKENYYLREYLNFLRIKRQSTVLANIIGQRKEMGYQWLILDKGLDDNVQLDYPIIDSHGYLVGKIVKVEKDYSFMLPILDSHFLTTVDFLSKFSQTTQELISGLAQGKHGLALEVNYIPIDCNLNEGDYVITSGLETNVPRGLIVGMVEEIYIESGASFQRAIIAPAVLPDNLRIVGIIVP